MRSLLAQAFASLLICFAFSSEASAQTALPLVKSTPVQTGIPSNLVEFFEKIDEEEPPEERELKRCPERLVFKNVTESSMQGLLDSGQRIKIDELYYNCREVKRGDLIVVAKNPFVAPVFRKVIAVPGDKFDFVVIKGAEFALMRINGEVLKNPKGESFELTKDQLESYQIWMKSYESLVPPQTYFVLNSQKQGSLDSRDFGPVVPSQIHGHIYP